MPGHDAQVDFGLAEFGGVGGDDEIAHHGQFAAAAKRVTRNSGDDRLAAAQDRLGLGREKVFGQDLVEGFFGHFLDVRPGGKGLVRAGDDDAAHLVVLGRLGDGCAEFGQQFPIERVQRIGAVQADGGDAFLGLDDDRLKGHGVSSLGFWSEDRVISPFQGIKLSLTDGAMEAGAPGLHGSDDFTIAIRCLAGFAFAIVDAKTVLEIS